MDRVYQQLLLEAPELDMTGRRKMTIPLQFETGSLATPTKTRVGAFVGFSMATWATPAASKYEQLFSLVKIPEQINPSHPVILKLLVALGGTEATPTNMAFEAALSGASIADKLAATIDYTTTSDDIPVIAGSLATYSLYEVRMVLYSASLPVVNALTGDLWVGGRLRRVAPSGDEINNRPIIVGGVLEFTVDKIFGKF